MNMNKTSSNGSGVEKLLHQMNNTLPQYNATFVFSKLNPPLSYLSVVGTLSVFELLVTVQPR